MNVRAFGFFDSLFPSTGILWVLASFVLTAIVHVAFALAVHHDAEAGWRDARRRTQFVGAGIWALATLLGGVFVAAIYWLMHHSTLALSPRPEVLRADAPRSH